MSDYLDPNNEELLKDFFAEAEQQVDNLESNVLVIENDPTNRDAIDEIFRAAHTLKGGSATVEMSEISSFTHKVEDMLDEIRSDKVDVTESVIDVLLDSIDVIKAMLEQRANGQVYSENTDELVSRIHSFISEKEKSAPKASTQKAPPKEAPKKVEPVVQKPVAQSAPVQAPSSQTPSSFVWPTLSENDFIELRDSCESGQNLWCVAVKFDENNLMNSVGGIQVFAALKGIGSVLKTVPDFDALYEDTFYENVFYYVATSDTQEQIEDIAFLDDVTLATDA
ncbi:MAG: Hpt domain-containing protein, partial [Treponema sp.]|nr:Hpt domain-containing protein [Treponema sp.]